MNLMNETMKQETQRETTTSNSSPKIAVRFYENQKLGKSFGPAKFHTAVYNATADIVNPHQKYLLDYVTFQNWIKSARDDDQLAACDHVQEIIEAKKLNKDDILGSWIKRYDRSNSKIMIPGFSTFELSSHALDVCIIDDDFGIQSIWNLEARGCRSKYGQKSPQLLAANYPLEHV